MRQLLNDTMLVVWMQLTLRSSMKERVQREKDICCAAWVSKEQLTGRRCK
jgi:hypothetical protein